MLIEAPIPIRYIFGLIKKEFFICLAIAGTLSYFDQFFVQWVENLEYFLESNGWVDDIEMELVFPIIPMTIPTILGATITLALAFRMNQSYDRWWEGRKVWGSIVNNSRTLIREATYLFAREVDDLQVHTEFKNNLINLLMAWNHALLGAMREKDTTSDILRFISEEKLEEIKAYDTNLANACLFAMLELVNKVYQKGIITEYQQIQINRTINCLNDAMGKSERIKHTIFPHLYSNLMEYSIWSFVFILPIAYRDFNEYVEFPIVMVISLFFLLLEKLAEGLQDPFDNKPTDVPITSIVRNIEIFALTALGSTDIPEKIKPDKFYLM